KPFPLLALATPPRPPSPSTSGKQAGQPPQTPALPQQEQGEDAAGDVLRVLPRTVGGGGRVQVAVQVEVVFGLQIAARLVQQLIVDVQRDDVGYRVAVLPGLAVGRGEDRLERSWELEPWPEENQRRTQHQQACCAEPRDAAWPAADG